MQALPILSEEFQHDFFWTLTPQGFHKVAYLEWGNSINSSTLLCLHGLTRNCRDFDYLARSLRHAHRIVCPDLLGRGDSDYLNTPQGYSFAQYMNDMTMLIARLRCPHIHWLGTSLGGIIGMMLAAQPNSPIKSLILNDVGMIIPNIALQRLATYARNDNTFMSFHEAKTYFQTVLTSNGITEPEHWNHITQCGIKRNDKGDFCLSYDPQIGQLLVNESNASLHLESYWQAIKCPILVIRGEESDFLLPEIITKMLYFQPNTKVVTISNCGHAPSLMTLEQIKIVEDWLKEVEN